MPQKFKVVVNRRAEQDDTEILVHGPIGKSFWTDEGISGKEITDAINAVPKGSKITIGVNSQGGAVGEGLAIYNAIARRSQDITVRIDGYAISIASFFPMAAGRVVSPKSSIWMIHKAWNYAQGNADQMRKDADLLDTHDEVIAAAYVKKTGKGRQEMVDMMAAETWLSGAEAIELGLADEEGQNAVDLEQVGMSCYRNNPGDVANFLANRRVPVALNAKNNPPPSAAGQTQKDKMNKAAILALLKQHGKTIADDATEEQCLAALNELVTANKITKDEAEKAKAPKAPNILLDANAFAKMEADLRSEREARIRQQYELLALDRAYLDAGEWLPKLYNDESLLKTLAQMPVMPRGGAPVITSITAGRSLVDDYRKLTPGAERLRFAMSHWHSLEEAHASQRIAQMSSLPIQEQIRRLQMPSNSNTYSATLVTDRLADQIIVTIGTKLAALRGFSKDFGVDRLKPRSTVQVRKATVGSATLTNATNFETGGSTTVPVSVTVNQLTQLFSVTNDELNKGHTLMAVADKNAQTFANSISDAWTALLTTDNYGTALQIGAAANFDASDLAPIYAAAKNYGVKNLILDGGHLAYLLPTDKFKFRLGEEGAYNFDLIAEQNRWTGAAVNTVGFICDPAAIAVCSGLPAQLPSSEFIELGVVEILSLGITVQICHWYSRAGREHWMSYDVMFGAAAGDTTAAEVITI